MKAFVYKWTDNGNGKHKYYIGSHKISNQKSGKGYFNGEYIATSDYFMEQYIQRPQDFIREILQEFDSYEESYEFETKLLNEVNAAKSEEYYNKHNNTPGHYHNKGHTQEAKDKVSKANKGKRLGVKLSEEHKRNISKSNMGHIRNVGKFKGENNPMWGRTTSDYQKKRASETNKGKTVSDTTKEKMRQNILNNNPMYNENSRNKMIETKREQWEKLPEKDKSQIKLHLKELSKTANKKIWRANYPNGDILLIRDLNEYCKNNGFSRAALYVAYNRGLTYRNIKFENNNKKEG